MVETSLHQPRGTVAAVMTMLRSLVLRSQPDRPEAGSGPQDKPGQARSPRRLPARLVPPTCHPTVVAAMGVSQSSTRSHNLAVAPPLRPTARRCARRSRKSSSLITRRQGTRMSKTGIKTYRCPPSMGGEHTVGIIPPPRFVKWTSRNHPNLSSPLSHRSPAKNRRQYLPIATQPVVNKTHPFDYCMYHWC